MIESTLRPIFPVMQYPTYLRELDNGILTSLPTDTPEGQAALFSAIDGEAYKGADAMNQIIKVVHVTVHPAARTLEETGETDEWLRVVFHTQESDCLLCMLQAEASV